MTYFGHCRKEMHSLAVVRALVKVSPVMFSRSFCSMTTTILCTIFILTSIQNGSQNHVFMEQSTINEDQHQSAAVSIVFLTVIRILST